MSSGHPIPETKVLAIASHVVYGYVGNTMATFIMQSLGCDVAALNTVQFSNHTAYKQFRGTRATGQEIRDVYEGLKQNRLTDFDVLLSGYAPGAEAVEAVGAIARDLRLNASTKPGSFFWVLDPVMGDQGRLYVNEDVVPVYKHLLRDADLVLPNQFEAELLSGIKISSWSALRDAITSLHAEHRIPHIVVTSVRLDPSAPTLSVIGSSRRSDCGPRIFRIDVPALDCFFSGTGDMFAALTVVRLREAVEAAGLASTASWLPADGVGPTELPLARAVEKVLASMHAVLERTARARDEALKGDGPPEAGTGDAMGHHLRATKAAEVRVVRNVEHLRSPEVLFGARPLVLE